VLWQAKGKDPSGVAKPWAMAKARARASGDDTGAQRSDFPVSGPCGSPDAVNAASAIIMDRPSPLRAAGNSKMARPI